MRILVAGLMLWAFLGCGRVEDLASSLQQRDAHAADDPGRMGLYAVDVYEPPQTPGGYHSLMLYYPLHSQEEQLPAITLSGGFSDVKERLTWLGQHLASHGFIVGVFTPRNRFALDAQVWADGQKASVATLMAESERADSPIAHRLDPKRMGLMGHSLGAAGVMRAIDQLGDQVRAGIALCAFHPYLPSRSLPLLMLTGTHDIVAAPNRILTTFQRLQGNTPRAFAKLNKLDHDDVVEGGPHHENLARFITAWSQLYVAERTAYQTYINGVELEKQIHDRRVFARISDYIFKP